MRGPSGIDNGSGGGYPGAERVRFFSSPCKFLVAGPHVLAGTDLQALPMRGRPRMQSDGRFRLCRNARELVPACKRAASREAGGARGLPTVPAESAMVSALSNLPACFAHRFGTSARLHPHGGKLVGWSPPVTMRRAPSSVPLAGSAASTPRLGHFPARGSQTQAEPLLVSMAQHPVFLVGLSSKAGVPRRRRCLEQSIDSQSVCQGCRAGLAGGSRGFSCIIESGVRAHFWLVAFVSFVSCQIPALRMLRQGEGLHLQRGPSMSHGLSHAPAPECVRVPCCATVTRQSLRALLHIPPSPVPPSLPPSLASAVTRPNDMYRRTSTQLRSTRKPALS